MTTCYTKMHWAYKKISTSHLLRQVTPSHLLGWLCGFRNKFEMKNTEEATSASEEAVARVEELKLIKAKGYHLKKMPSKTYIH